MAKKLKLGIIGMSKGNGHPYSWSAIFNGYDTNFMKDCVYQTIPAYLSKQEFPKDGLSLLGKVTHIWTQDKNMSQQIAQSSKIDNVVENMDDMIGNVDGILLARDDAENHYKIALPFLRAGLPIFIDKPLALTVEETKLIWAAQVYPDQIFSCSSLRYAKELSLSEQELHSLGKIIHVEGTTMKEWDTYAVHLIEPIISQLPRRGKLIQTKSIYKNNFQLALIEWETTTCYLKTTGNCQSPIEISFFGENMSIKKQFSDSFGCFKTSLVKFINIINNVENNIDKHETLEIINIIEKIRGA